MSVVSTVMYHLMAPSTTLLCVLCFITGISGNGQFSERVGNILNFVQDTLATVQSYVGEPGGCRYTCPDGSKPKANPYHKNSSNGCGSFGFQLENYVTIERLTECCNKHDVCYDTCNEPKKTCDHAFKKCLERICEKMKKHVTKDMHKACHSAGDMMYAGTIALGCKAYKDAQEKACICSPKKHVEL